MVVVAIIGILASLAVPRFKVFQARARQAEAKSNLALIYTMEEAYFADHDAYVAFAGGAECAGASGNPLGFIVECGSTRYTYSVTVSTSGFTATAVADKTTKQVYPGCSTTDTWTINEAKLLTNTVDAIATCK